jgi:hypothetical protein
MRPSLPFPALIPDQSNRNDRIRRHRACLPKLDMEPIWQKKN